MRRALAIASLAAGLGPAGAALGQVPVLRRIPLTDLPWVSAEGGWGPVEIDTSVGGPDAGDGSELTVDGQVFRRGLGTASTSLVTYDLAARARWFSSWVGVDDEVGNSDGSVIFRVVADGVTLFDSGVLTGADPALFTGRLDVLGVRELQLVVADASDGYAADHADWGDPLVSAAFGQDPTGNGALFRYLRGTWEPALSWPVMAIHASLLPTGEILSHASVLADAAGTDSPADPHDSTRVDVADPATWSHQSVDHESAELFASGHARLSDGTLLALGGHAGRDATLLPFGQEQCSTFDCGSSCWLPGPAMLQARQGPGALTLGDGDVLAIGGAHAGGNLFLPEVFDGCRWRTVGNVDYLPWLDIGEPEVDHTFPFAHLASDGRVFWSGWGKTMAFLDTTGNGAWGTTFQREPRERAFGSCALHATDRVLLAGGVNHTGSFGNAQRTAVTVDFSGPTPTVQPTGRMLFLRADADATILADGKVLLSGGGYTHASGANPTHVRVPEIWDPATGEWDVAAAAAHPRGYRSTALLLPDGRVWTAGGECGVGCTSHMTAEVFHPPYLYRPGSGQPAPRPVIFSAPAALSYGQTFQVKVTKPDPVSRVTLVRLGSSTHGVDLEQRFLELDFTQNVQTLTVDAPATGNIAPPGHYMLFVFDGAGVPSVARILHLSMPSPATWQIHVSSDGSAPVPRHEAAMLEVGGKFFLMGGRGSRPVQRFDPVEGTWTNLGHPPIQMHHYQPVVFEGLVYVLCAFEGGYPNETPIDDIWIYDPSDNSWTLGPPIPAGRNRGSAGTVVYDGKIWVAGGNTMGHNGGYVPWLDVYDPAAQSWTALADAPNARDHFTAVVVGNKLIAAGGRRTDQPNPFDDTVAQVDVYDFASGQWSANANDIPTERGGTMAVAVGQHAVVVGGESDTMSEAHAEVEALDVLTGEWFVLPDLVQDRHSGGIGVHHGRIWVASGSGGKGGGPELNTAEVLGAADLLAGTSVNPLANAGFDAGLAGWTDAGELALSGLAGVKSPSLEVQLGEASQVVAASPGTAYTLSALYRATSGAGTVELAMEYRNAGGTPIGQDAVQLSATTRLTSASVSGTTPAGTASIRVRLHADGQRVLTVDDVVLVTD